MKLMYLGILYVEDDDGAKAHEVAVEKDVNHLGRLERTTASELMTTFAKMQAERTERGTRTVVEQHSFCFHVHKPQTKDNLVGVIVSDDAYPSRVAQGLLSKIVDEFHVENPKSRWPQVPPTIPFPSLKEYIVQYQNPEEADALLKIQKELDETKEVLHKTIESTLRRGEKLDDIVAKSGDLSIQSRMFFKTAQKQNSCCVVM